MANKFNLAEIMGERLPTASEMQIVEIPLRDILPNEDNFYSVNNVDDLADSIALVGLQQPLVVKAFEGKYKLITGHRRLKALSQLEHKAAPCVILKGDDATLDGLRLIFTNSTSRELNFTERNEAVKRVEKSLLELKAQGVSLPGKMRTIVANLLDEKETKIANMKVVDGKLSDGWKAKLNENKIPFSLALDIARTFPPEMQDKLLKLHKDDATIPGIYALKEDALKIENPWILEQCPEANYKTACYRYEPIIRKHKADECDRACCAGCEKILDCDAACGSAVGNLRRDERDATYDAEAAAFLETPLGGMGGRIKAMREASGISRGELAEMMEYPNCEWDEYDVANFEDADDYDDIAETDAVFALSKALKCTSDYLLGLSSI